MHESGFTRACTFASRLPLPPLPDVLLGQHVFPHTPCLWHPLAIRQPTTLMTSSSHLNPKLRPLALGWTPNLWRGALTSPTPPHPILPMVESKLSSPHIFSVVYSQALMAPSKYVTVPPFPSSCPCTLSIRPHTGSPHQASLEEVSLLHRPCMGGTWS